MTLIKEVNLVKVSVFWPNFGQKLLDLSVKLVLQEYKPKICLNLNTRYVYYGLGYILSNLKVRPKKRSQKSA